MKQPARIRFVGMEPSEAVEAAARKKLEKLDLFHPDIMACRVTIALDDKHSHQGRSFNVRVDVTVPDHEIAADRSHDEDVYVALRDAFDDVRRQLQDSVRRVRGQEKQHVTPLRGHVARFADEGRCGFIVTAEGDEYWFGPDNVVGAGYDALAEGTPVQFIPDVAAGGRQAKRVSVGKHAPA